MRSELLRAVVFAVAVLALAYVASASAPMGYYRQPARHDGVILFVAEGDIWKVKDSGGVATRLTSHPGDEGTPAISPDGATVAFTAQYEGPTELYTMPMSGGLPVRRTFEGVRAGFVGWTPDGKVMVSTLAHSTLPNAQLITIDISGEGNGAGERRVVPLAQAADGCFDRAGGELFFTRLAFQGSHTKRYMGGTAQNIWRFADGDEEATPLTGSYAGTSKQPMWWNGRVYFLSDRDGTMNIWSMGRDGSDLRQHTRHEGWDAAGGSLWNGRVVYQLGADIREYDIAADTDRAVPITLDSDLDQMRENWVKKPMEYLTAFGVSANGDRAVLTARGRVFVAPQRQGRLVEAARRPGVRYRAAQFFPDGKSLLVMSDESGEVELWRTPANGVGESTRLTHDGSVLRMEAAISPDGRRIAHADKDYRLFVLDTQTGENRMITQSAIDAITELSWSPDGQWLAYVERADNAFSRVMLHGIEGGVTAAVTSDRFDSFSPAWSPDGKWLYVLSDRNLRTLVPSPWGSHQPEPFLNRKTKVYHIALSKGQRSPFAPKDELQSEKKDPAKKEEPAPTPPPATPPEPSATPSTPEPQKRDEPATGHGAEKPGADAEGGKKKEPGPKLPEVKIDLDGITERLEEVPIPPGTYTSLSVTEKALLWLSMGTEDRKRSLVGAAITNENVEVKTVLADVAGYRLTEDRKSVAVRKGDSLYIVDAAPAEAKLDKKDVDLSRWTLSVIPREEWRQMFVEAWRLERDYFYDRAMHGVDWPAMLEKYLPLVERVTTRAELSDAIAQMVGELSALHIFVSGGDLRTSPDQIAHSSLGAELVRDRAGGGFRVARIYRSDPDEPEVRSPLSRPGVDVAEGDVIELVNGVPALEGADVALLLRNQAGRQVLLRVRPGAGGEAQDVIVTPLSMGAAADLRYHEWQYTRRLLTEELSGGDFGYIHLRAMGGENFTEWAKGYYPVFNRKGLIIDVRHNRGGNIDSWLLGRLMRRAWFYWNDRIGRPPMWNMHYAFRGHVVVLCNERTASDGEAFAEGVKRLGLGKVIGTRTWGGEIWLSSSNFLVDRGIATAAEYGVYGPEGEWLIEGHGVDPDLVVDNLPHATFKGEDAQLKAAIAYLKEKLKTEPVEVPPVPPFPDKSFRTNTRNR